MKTADNNSKFPIFSSRLTELRGVKSRQSVANDLEITRQSLEYYEKGLRLPDVQILAKIAKYYNVSADYLLGLTEQKNADKDLAAAADYLGLSEKSIETLKNSTTPHSSYIGVIENDDYNFSRDTNSHWRDILNWIIEYNIVPFVVEIDRMLLEIDNSKGNEDKNIDESLYTHANRLTDRFKFNINKLVGYYSTEIARGQFHSIFSPENYFYFRFDNDESKKAGD